MRISKYVLSALMLSATLNAFAGAEDVFRVGVILPLSGEAAAVGAAVQNGMFLALESLPTATREKIQLIFEDDALQPKNTIAAFHKLRSREALRAVVTASSGTSKALAPLAEEARLPLLAIATDPAVVKNRQYAVNVWTTAHEEARVTVPEALRRGYRRIARISTIQDFTMAMKTEFDAENGGKMEILLDEDFDPSVKDFRSYIGKLRALKDLDAVLISMMPGQLGLFAKQARQMGVQAPFFGFEVFEDSSEVKVSDGALVGQWYVSADDPGAAFVSKYQQRFPGASVFGAFAGHDIVLMLAKGAESNMHAGQLNDWLHSLRDFHGAMGTFSASGTGGFTIPSVVKVVTKDGFQKL